VSLDGAPSGEDEGVSGAEILAGSVESAIDDEINLSQEVGFLRDAILELKDQERTVLSLYYYEDLKLHEIAVALGVTESRVSQIRTKALSNLRSRLAPLREPATTAPRRRTPRFVPQLAAAV
jgi:RNA polymerase sigma factor for flagellar operon FliA